MLKYRFKQDDSTDYPDWENTKLSNIADITMGQSPSSKSYNNDKTGLPLLQGNADINNYYTLAEKYSSQPTKICEKNDVIMTVRAPVGELGIASEKSCLGRGVCSLRSKYGDNLYIFYLLQANKIKWKKTEVGSTYKAVDKKSLQEFKVSVPLATEEQQKIADFLSAVDNQIDIQRQRVETMETQKKGLLDKVFSQELRFKRDDSSDYPDWEEDTIENVSESISAGGDKPNTFVINETVDCHIPVYANSEVNKGIFGFTDRPRVKAPAITITARGSLGYTFVRYNDFVPIVRLLVLLPKQGINIEYLKLSIDNSLSKIVLKTGSAVKQLTVPMIKPIKVIIPHIEEQKKIADFFTAIDNQIDIEKQRLITMKTIKKGLLQQMFC